MKSWVYYNENDRQAAAWLRELIKEKILPEGEIDERSIVDVKGKDLEGFRHCHFFAGIGGWAYALQLAGWPNEREVWTGSCPCQPFSDAGKNAGLCDERHLWPAFRGLIAERRPAGIFGEQVASKAGRAWLAGVRSDLEGMGHAFGGADLCAAGVGAAHRRQRLFWMAVAKDGGRKDGRRGRGGAKSARGWRADIERCVASRGMGNADSEGRSQRSKRSGETVRMADADGRDTGDGKEQRGGEHGLEPNHGGVSGPVADVLGAGLEGLGGDVDRGSQSGRLDSREIGSAPAGGATSCVGRMDDAMRGRRGEGTGEIQTARDTVGGPSGSGGLGDTASGGCREFGDEAFAREGGYVIGSEWARFDLIPCRDGKARRVESGSFPLADGIPGRVGLLRGYGNAIVPGQACEFILACEEAISLTR